MMFHVKHLSRPWALIPLMLAIPLMMACAGVSNDPEGWSSPSSILNEENNELLIIRLEENRIAAVDLDSNAIVWQFPSANGGFPGIIGEIESRGYYGTPVLSPEGDELLLGDYDKGLVYAIRVDGTSARIILDTGDKIIGSLLVDGKTKMVYISTTGRNVYAIDVENPPTSAAESQWKFSGVEHDIWGTAALATSRTYGQLLIIPSMNGTLYAVNREENTKEIPQIAWEFPTGGAIAGNVVVHEGTAFIGSFDRHFYAVDIETGNKKWMQRGDGWFWTTALIDSDTVYAADLKGKLWAWNTETGQLKPGFPYDTGAPVRAKPIFDAKRTSLLVVTRAKEIHFIDPENGIGLWNSRDLEIALPNKALADPILHKGHLYLNDDKGLLIQIAPLEDTLAGLPPWTELPIIPEVEK